MFIKFSKEKANYRQGQVFPLMIAVIALILVMVMITGNLGKVAIFKTDVSNAADAGALSAASVLSGTLLGIGLGSDAQCGAAVIMVCRWVCIFAAGYDFGAFGNNNTSGTQTNTDNTTSQGDDLKRFPKDLIKVVMLYIEYLIDFFADYIMAMNDGMMAWSNAKLSALRYAYNNSGVDEAPNTPFKNYGGSYETYLADPNITTGFSNFMKHARSGYGYPVGEIKPGEMAPFEVQTGYGWTQKEDGTYEGSCGTSGACAGNSSNYADFENYVEVTARGSTIYPLEALTFADYFPSSITTIVIAASAGGAYVKYMTNDKCKGWWCYIIWAIYAIIDAAVLAAFLATMPVGFTFPDRDMARQTTENPVTVEVKRFKRDKDLGMWGFNYGTVSSRSGAHAFPEQTGVTIEPVFLKQGDFQNVGTASGDMTSLDWSDPEIIESTNRQILCAMVVFMDACVVVYGIQRRYMNEDWSAGLNPGGYIMSLILSYLILDRYCDTGGDSANITGSYTGGLTEVGDDWFETARHLFETELDSRYVN